MTSIWSESSDTPVPKAVGTWLMVCCALVAAMVVVGGLTRLTHSGLSMVEWKPFTGFLPPMDDAAWQALFDKYKQFPEFRLINKDMTLDGFKGIFWLEFLHRVLGRVIGLVFLLPLLWFLVRRQLSKPLAARLVGYFVLGGLQGVLGWVMVRSGLVDRPDVSHYRLAAHLGLALVIFALMFREALRLLDPHPVRTVPGLRRATAWLLGLIAVTVIAGAFVAGLEAGLSYNTFPLMNGQLIPDGLAVFDPWWLNPLENTVTVQFQHRMLALLTTVAAVACAWWGREFWAFRAVGLVALLQATLGVLTLLHEVPVGLASAHQAGAVVLLAAALWARHRTAPAPGRGRPS